MFFPTGVALTKKEKLSLIWLAANYDPEKYKKIIPGKKCEEANIEQICNAIMSPNVPYALRLSAQLLLGTVRVYRTKTKIILEMAEQMILKLSSLITVASSRNYDMPVAMLRADAITLADTGMSIIDYSLEPVYYDPQMIMHMNEEDFITVNGSPLQSPIKVEKKGVSKKALVATHTKSPLVVSNSKISFQEDLLSPSKPIQVPTEEEDFGALGFGPAQDNFLTDLMEISDITDLKPKSLNFGPDEEEFIPTKLDTVIEDEEDPLALPLSLPLAVTIDQEHKAGPIDQELKAESPNSLTKENIEEAIRKIEGDVRLKEDLLQEEDEGVTSRKRKLDDDEDDMKSMTSGTMEQVEDLDKLLKDAIKVNIALAEVIDTDLLQTKTSIVSDPLPIHQTREQIHDERIPDDDADPALLKEAPVDKLTRVADVPMDLPTDVVMEEPPVVVMGEAVAMGDEHVDVVMEDAVEKEVVDEAGFTGETTAKKSRRTLGETSVAGVPDAPADWDFNMQTPSDAIILKPLPSQPKKKRKLMVDKDIYIEAKEMRKNFTTPDGIIRVPMIAGSAFLTGKEMFGIPMFSNSLPALNFWWENSTIKEQGDPIALVLPEESPSEEEEVIPLHAEALPLPAEQAPVVEEEPYIEPEPFIEPPSVGPGSIGPSSVGPPSVGPPSVASQDINEEILEEEIIEREILLGDQLDPKLVTPLVDSKVSGKHGGLVTGEKTTSYDETPSSIDIMRGDGSDKLQSFVVEQSGGSIAMRETPIVDASKASLGDINIEEDILAATPRGASPRISGISMLPPEGIDMEEAPELEPVLEQDEKSIDFTAAWMDDKDILTEEYKVFQRKIFHSLQTSENTVFQRLFPQSRTTKRNAALALYLTLNMHKNGFVELQQDELFGEIHIKKGRIS